MSASSVATPLDDAGTDNNRKRRRALLLVVAVSALLFVLWLLWWLLVLSQRETTDNAYVAGHQVQIAAQVAGTVVAVQADDTQHVAAGQLLVQLDDADARLALDRAGAELARTVRQVRQLRDTAALNDALLTTRRLELAQAQEDLRRRLPLRQSRAIAPELLVHFSHQVELSQAALTAAQKQAAASRDVAGGATLADHPAIRSARSAYVDAWLRLQRTHITTPVAGTVAQRTVQAGYHVDAGVALMRVVPADQMWVDANFKEVELRHLRIGQPARIEVDLYGGETIFKGHVAGFSPGTGAAFALLPPQNAAGNWVKVVQRVPVRIALEDADLKSHPLLIGLSAHVKIDTHDRSGPQLIATAPTLIAALPPPQDTNVAEAQADQIIAENAEVTVERP